MKKTSITLHSGNPDMPAVILIHGLGMNNYFWVDPKRCFVLGGLAPLTIFLTDTIDRSHNTISFGTTDPHIRGLWDCLKSAGYSLASWTQSQPLGPVNKAIKELATTFETVKEKWPQKPVYLVGHSRGGLIARKFLLQKPAPVIEGLITICSPHAGTDMAKFSRHLKPVGKFLEKLLPDQSRAALIKALSRISEFFQSPALEELTPQSDFIVSLQKPLPEALKKLSFGGTSPSLFKVMLRLPNSELKIIRFPDFLAPVIPEEHLPKELTPGLGDALVAAESAILSGSKHFDFSDNHVKAAYDKKIHQKILEFLRA